MVNVGLLVIRVVVGLVVAGHGAQKLFGWFGGPGLHGFGGGLERMGVRPARAWAVVAAIAELAGGIAVALGLLTPIAALAVCGAMLTAITLVHLPKGFWNSKGGYEFPLTILGAMAGLALAGPGRLSLDAAFGIRLPEPATLVVVAILVVLGVAATLASRSLLRARAEPKTQAG